MTPEVYAVAKCLHAIIGKSMVRLLDDLCDGAKIVARLPMTKAAYEYATTPFDQLSDFQRKIYMGPASSIAEIVRSMYE